MKPITIMFVLMLSLIVMACGGETTSDSNSDTSNLTSQEQAELVAATLSNNQGGVGADLSRIPQAAGGQTAQQTLNSPQASFGYSVSITVDYYDVFDQLQEGYDALTTDRIDYDSSIQGEITDGTGFFAELSIDNRSDFTVDEILSRTVWINGIHTNKSSYKHINPITDATLEAQLDCALTATDITLDLDAGDTFPESGTLEGSIIGSYERRGPFGTYSRSVDFHFIATYLGDNTAEIELDDGRVYTVRLENGAVEEVE